jgi:hypothetical protein
MVSGSSRAARAASARSGPITSWRASIRSRDSAGVNSGWAWTATTRGPSEYAATGQCSDAASTVAPSGRTVTWSWWLANKVSSWGGVGSGHPGRGATTS